MTQISIPDFNPATIARAIRAAVPPSPPVSTQGAQEKVADDVPSISLPRLSFQTPRVAKDRYRLEEMLRYHGREFIANAYLCLLRRPADPQGLNAYLQKLWSGEFSRIDILGRIRFSVEGRKHGIRIEGLMLPLILQTLGRTPLVGGLFRYMSDLAAMPAVSRANEKCHAEASVRQNDVGDHLNILTRAAEMHLAALREELSNKIGTTELDKLNRLIDTKAETDIVAANHRDLQSQLETEFCRKQAELTAVHHEISVVSAKIAGKVAADHRDLRSLLEAEFNRSQTELTAVHHEISVISEKLAGKVDASRLDERLAAVAGNIDAMHGEIRSLLETKADSAALREILARMAATRDELDAAIHTVQEELSDQDQALIAALALLNALQQKLGEKADHAQLADLYEDVARRAVQMTELRQSLDEKADFSSIAKVQGLLMTKADIGQLRQMTANLGAQATGLTDQFQQLSGQFDEKLAKLASVDYPVGERFNQLFVAFADEFRGPRDEVKERMRYYLPFLEQVVAECGDGPVLDVGCGRGEFLELLREQGIIGSGIDLNPEHVRVCNEAELRADCADALEFLASQPSESLSAITAFHVIEHLPLSALLELLQGTFRVLSEGGVAIFETPNPRNVLVGSCNFYLDPTHRHPLPPQLAKFLFEQAGFREVEIHPLNPSTSHQVEEVSDLANRFNQYFYGSMDYGIVARKKGLS